MSRRLTAIGLLLVCLLIAVIALMRPQGRFQRTDVSTIGAQIMVCLDVSRSMLAEDSKPNRLERAKAEIVDLLSLLDGDQVGLTAFAGNAAVMCPMTTDFGFLRLLMREIGVHSVGRGGTKLAEPIKKAIEGFGQASDISRIVLLITDGEDQDSFPLEAAKQARERGIRIITVGFGDENGSSIEITNPETGATDFVRDESGNKVISKLDGDLLRQIALETEGVYIPAGTGSLDLESIYKEHISKLVRANIGEKQELIRTEFFQIPVAFSLLFLLAFIVLRNGLTPSRGLGSANLSVVMAFLAVSFFFTGASDSFGQATPATEPNIDEPSKDVETPAENGEQKPRDIYNQAVALMNSDLSEADQLLQKARREAGPDGEVRYRSAYNLGWVLSKQADGKLESEPENALELLRQSADWFNRAIRIRPKEEDARHNFEIVLRRAMELEDSLKKKDDRDIAQSIDELIGQQRGVLAETGQLLETIKQEDRVDPDAQQHRTDFRKLAVSQRQLLGEAQRILEQVADELESNKDVKPEEMEQQQKLRMLQLSMAAPFLQNAVQRMGQARQQMRMRNQNRAFRREAIAIDELKQSRDAFREPYEKIRILLNDSTSVFQQTGLLYAGERELTVADDTQVNVPAWLTQELLEESQDSINARIQRLAEECRLMFEHVTKSPPPDTADGKSGQASPQPSKQQVEDLAEISKHVDKASQEFQATNKGFKDSQLDEVLTHQMNGISSLRAAEEYLLGLRELIEKVYASESSVRGYFDQMPETQGRMLEFLQFVASTHEKNRDRLARLSMKISDEAAKLTNASGNPTDQSSADDATQKQEQQRYELAARLTSEIVDELRQVDELLGEIKFKSVDGEIDESEQDDTKASTQKETNTSAQDGADEPTKNPASKDALSPAIAHVDQSVSKLQELRRLFFTIVEHLQENAQYQLDLNDQTEKLKEADDSLDTRGPLSQTQLKIATDAELIGRELLDQAKTIPQNAPQDAEQASLTQAVEQYQQAGQLVSDAFAKMQSAVDELKKDQDFDLKSTRENQDGALQDVLVAIKILQPPQPEQQDQQNQDDSQQDQQNDQSQEQDEEQQSNPSTNQLLQLVQDREAQRREEKKKRSFRVNRNADKDW